MLWVVVGVILAAIQTKVIPTSDFRCKKPTKGEAQPISSTSPYIDSQDRWGISSSQAHSVAAVARQ